MTRNSTVPMPEKNSVVAGGKPVSSGTRNVAPNIATTCCAPIEMVRGHASRSRGVTTSPGATCLPSPCSRQFRPSRSTTPPRRSCSRGACCSSRRGGMWSGETGELMGAPCPGRAVGAAPRILVRGRGKPAGPAGRDGAGQGHRGCDGERRSGVAFGPAPGSTGLCRGNRARRGARGTTCAAVRVPVEVAVRRRRPLARNLRASTVSDGGHARGPRARGGRLARA